MIKRKRLTRKQFEALFSGQWTSHRGDRYRRNQDFETSIQGRWRVLKTNGFAVRGRNWLEIAKALKLKEGEGEVNVQNLNKARIVKTATEPMDEGKLGKGDD